MTSAFYRMIIIGLAGCVAWLLNLEMRAMPALVLGFAA